MAENDNLNQDPNNDPFAHPVKNNNWWMYILGGIVFAGLIIWFFINWSYKNRNREPEPVQTEEPAVAPAPTPTEQLPAVTVEAPEENAEAQEAN